MNREEWDKAIQNAFENPTIIKTVEERAKEFLFLKYSSAESLFMELTFCTLTANTSAELGIKCINRLRDVDFSSVDNIRSQLRKCGYRFPNTRSKYININYGKKHILEMIRDIDEPEFRRDIIFESFIGIGYKEASHFLRNIGYFEYAILDKHILKFMSAYFNREFSNKSRKAYMEGEGYFKRIAEEYNTDPGIMDLILWYLITGKILK